ncbi:MAG: saccharopine dehydrogenase NADP-binding domain-containing protein, partial [Bacteroidota bacterium]
MKNILLFGAGKSATVLINYFLQNAEAEAWHLIVVDDNAALAKEKVGSSTAATVYSFNITDAVERGNIIAQADIVISLMPPTLHLLIARDCLQHRKNLLTASYIDAALNDLKNEIEESGLLFLCEAGLDPGIDHMSAKKMVDEI